jgi:type IV pilus assembly protein PilA
MLRHNNRRRGFSLIEMLIVVSIILIIITFAVPKFLKAQMSAHELGAIKAIQTIHQGEVQYQSQYSRYATSLQELGPPASGPATPSAGDLIGNDLAGGEKGGYKFTLTGNAGGYTISAVPVTFGSSGSRTFFSDQTMVIHQNFSAEPATVSSPEMK